MSSLLSQVLLAQMTHVVLQVVAVLLWIVIHLGLKTGDVRPHLPIKRTIRCVAHKDCNPYWATLYIQAKEQASFHKGTYVTLDSVTSVSYG